MNPDQNETQANTVIRYDVRRIERYGQFWIVAEVTRHRCGMRETSFEILTPKTPLAPYDPNNHPPNWVHSENGLPSELLQPAGYKGTLFDVLRKRNGVIEAMPSEGTPLSVDVYGSELLFGGINGPGFVAICNAHLLLETEMGRTPTRYDISSVLADDSRLIPRPPTQHNPVQPRFEIWDKGTITPKKIHPGLEKDHPQHQATFEGFSRITFKPLAGMGMCGKTIDFSNCMRYCQKDPFESNPRADNPEYVALCKRHTDGALLAASIIKEQFPHVTLKFDGFDPPQPAGNQVAPATPNGRVMVMQSAV